MQRGYGRGRGRGRGVTIPRAVTSSSASSFTDTPTTSTSSSPTVTVLSTLTQRSGHGGRVPPVEVVDVDQETLSSSSRSSNRPASLPTSSDMSPAPVVVIVPQGRMITRSLLRSTSSMYLEPAIDGGRCGSWRDGAGTGTLVKEVVKSEKGTVEIKPGNPASPPASSSSSGFLSTPPLPASPPPASTQRVVVGGLLRCVCNAFLVSPSETLLECSRCRNYCHPSCVGIDRDDARLYQRQRSYICPFCVTATGGGGGGMARDTGHIFLDTPPASSASVTTTLGESISVVYSPSTPPPPPRLANTFVKGVTVNAVADAGSPVKNSGVDSMDVSATSPTVPSASKSSAFPKSGRQLPVPRQAPQKLREVPDAAPAEPFASRLRAQLRIVETVAEGIGFEVLHLPSSTFTETQVAQCIDCCQDAVREATFSADYPVYCLKELQQQRHPYLQGTALRSKEDGIISAFVLSNGRDFYGNMRATITQLKSSLHRGFLNADDVTELMSECLAIADVSDFIHITLSATHARYQRHGLARLLMTAELLKWALRGRTRAFVNMAIEKHLVDHGTRIELASPVASRRLYNSFGFADLYPRYDPLTGKERWTAKEADTGRVMANLHFVPHVQAVAASLPTKYNRPRQQLAAPHLAEVKDEGKPESSLVEGVSVARYGQRRSRNVGSDGGGGRGDSAESEEPSRRRRRGGSRSPARSPPRL